MAPEDGGRRCLRCDRHLIDLSELTPAQVDDLRALARTSGARRLCAKVSLDADGLPIHRQRAVRRLVQTAAGVVMSMSLAACDAAGGAERERAPEPSVEMQPLPPAEEPARDPASDAVEQGTAGEATRSASESATIDTPAPDTTEAETAPPREQRPRRRRPTAAPEEDPIVGLLDL